MECKKKTGVIALDMGGTFIKYGLVSDRFDIEFADAVPADSGDDRETLLNRLAQALCNAGETAEKMNFHVRGIAVSTPGPFRYDTATSYMVGKYDSIYGIDLRAEFRHRAALLPEMPIEFMQDAAAFLLGEHTAGAAKGFENCMCVTLGTGVGYACILHNELLLNERKGPYYVLATQTDKATGKTVEELASGTALRQNNGVDVRTLAEKAKSGDDAARQVFAEQGLVIGRNLREIPELSKTQCLVIGGQISKDFALLEEGLRTGLGVRAHTLAIRPAHHPADAALIGAAKMLYSKL